MDVREGEKMCVCDINRVNGAGQASYGEADVGTYCPGLPQCTPERMDGGTTDRRATGGGEEGGKKKREAGTAERRQTGNQSNNSFLQKNLIWERERAEPSVFYRREDCVSVCGISFSAL